jgi:hypothetical protein
MTKYFRLWLTNDGPDLSSERTLHMKDSNCQTLSNRWSWAPFDTLLDWTSVAIWLWLSQKVNFTYQIFWEVVGLERGPLSLVSTVEELLERKSDSGLEKREYGRRDPSRWSRDTLYSHKLALTSPTSGGRSFGIVHSRTQATEFSFSSTVPDITVHLLSTGMWPASYEIYLPDFGETEWQGCWRDWMARMFVASLRPFRHRK